MAANNNSAPRVSTLSFRLALAAALGLCCSAGAANFDAGIDLNAKNSLLGVWIGMAWAPGQSAGPWKNTPWTPKPVFTTWGSAESKRLGDPQLSQKFYCLPGNPAEVMNANPIIPMQIAASPGQVLITMEGSPLQRRIYTDGRKHPEDPDLTYFGHSIGHWEGDTLVIDTVGIKSATRPLNGFVSPAVFATPIDSGPRLPLSDQLHLLERLRVVGKGQILEEDITIIDPKTYTNSFSAKLYSQRRPDLDIQEYYCQDNPRPDAEGYVKPEARNDAH